MNTVTDLFSSSWTEALGWTLLHSLWQSLLCAVIVIVVLRYIPSRLSNLRYAMATGGLLLIFLVSAGTFLHLNSAAFSISNETKKNIHTSTSFSVASYEYQSFQGLLTEVKSFIQSNIPFIVLIWSVGALLFSLRVFSGWWYTKKLRGNAIQLQNEWSQRVQQLAARLSITRYIMLAESAHIHAPVVIGYLKPMILIPLGMCSGLSTEQLESIFIHELIHIRRGDYFVNMMQSFLEALYFFNPFVWIVSGIMRREREHCCDDAVVKVNGNALAYAHALANLEEVRLSISGLALSLAENKKQLLNRIKRIMEKSVKSYSGRERVAPAVLLIIGLICASWLTIQSGKSEKDLAQQYKFDNEQSVAADTTIKEKSARYYRKKVTTMGEDGKPNDEIIEEFEGDEELRPMFPPDFDFEIPPIPDLADMADMEVLLPPMPDFDFIMDTIPFPVKQWDGDRDWDEFSKEFERNFKAKFGDFYQNHETELKNMMEEVERKFDREFDEEWTAKMETFALKHEELARRHAEKFEQNKDLWALQEEHKKKFEQDLRRWEEKEGTHLHKLEKNIKAMEENMKVFEKELTTQLIKDGYIDKDERINTMRWDDDGTIEINDKKIKPTDQQKYNDLHQRYLKKRTAPHRVE